MASGASAKISPLDARLADATAGFGLRLLGRLASPEKPANVFLSPASVALALTMTYNGAQGETQKAMAATLGLGDLSVQEVNQANASLVTGLQSPAKGATLSVANSLWVARNVALKQDFATRMRDFYRARIESVLFTDPATLTTINDWVAGQTHDKVKDLVKPGDLDTNTVLALLNAVHFKGTWTVSFDPKRTQDAAFAAADGSRPTVPMMTQPGKFGYLKGEGVEGVRLPYGRGDLAMYLFLPDRGTSLPTFAQGLTAGKWARWMAGFASREGTVSLPRFKLEYESDLVPALADLGMGIACRAGADFGGICAGPAWISVVRHKTFLDVNEEGTEAAGATAVIMTRGHDPDRFSFRADRPFLCAIRDERTGMLLFLGAIVRM